MVFSNKKEDVVAYINQKVYHLNKLIQQQIHIASYFYFFKGVFIEK